MQVIGQVNPTRFVHRLYQESHVRIRLVAFSDPATPDCIAGHAVDVRFGDGEAVPFEHSSTVFGNSVEQFNLAAAMYKIKVLDYVKKGVWK